MCAYMYKAHAGRVYMHMYICIYRCLDIYSMYVLYVLNIRVGLFASVYACMHACRRMVWSGRMKCNVMCIYIHTMYVCRMYSMINKCIYILMSFISLSTIHTYIHTYIYTYIHPSQVIPPRPLIKNSPLLSSSRAAMPVATASQARQAAGSSTGYANFLDSARAADTVCV